MEIEGRITSLGQEIVNNLPSLRQNIDSLINQMKALTMEEQKELCDFFLKKEFPAWPQLVENLWGRDEELALNLINNLGSCLSPQAAEILQGIATRAPNKKVSKAIRRALFRMKSKGLKVPEVMDQAPAIFTPPKLDPVQGYLTAYDSQGNRFVLFWRPKIPKGVLIVEIVLNDEEGIKDFTANEFTKRNSTEYLGELKQRIGFPLIESDPAYCLGLITEALEAGQRKGKNPPADFSQLLAYLSSSLSSSPGSSPLSPLKPIIYQYFPEEEIKTRPDLLDRSPSLFEIFPFDTWFLEKENIQKYYDLYKEASDSSLVLSPQQQQARLEDIYVLAAQELFDRDKRTIYRRRLEEMAYILLKEDKNYESRICLSAALALKKESGLLSPHPFLRELIKRSLDSLLSAEKEKEDSRGGDLIIKP